MLDMFRIMFQLKMFEVSITKEFALLLVHDGLAENCNQYFVVPCMRCNSWYVQNSVGTVYLKRQYVNNAELLILPKHIMNTKNVLK